MPVPKTVDLLPHPQRCRLLPIAIRLPPSPAIAVADLAPRLEVTVQRLCEGLVTCGLMPQIANDASGAQIALRVHGQLPHGTQSYQLKVGPDGVEVAGGDAAGLFYGVCTLLQWVRLHAEPGHRGPLEVGGIEVEDWPDFPHRGVMLDISRDKVPSMRTLRELVDLLASWKVNELQLYMEHTFAYRGHEAVWNHASPLLPDEVRELDAYCHSRFIELVPNQNSFGHFHRWLVHEPYRRLAECPEGIQHPFSERTEPFSLCPVDPASLDLLEDLYDQLLPLFRGQLFNVGLDETFDLGQGRSAAACAEQGKEEVYVAFLKQVYQRVRDRQRRMQFWSDIVIHRPDLVPSLPKEVVVMEWGYEADHPFDQRAGLLAQSGLEFYVCPGTSSWNSFAGRADNALGNLANAALHGKKHGALGYLNTDWGDWGHLQPLSVSYLGYAAGAHLSWNAASAEDVERLDIARLLDLHAFQDLAGTAGASALDLGNAYLHCGATPKNGSALFYLVLFGQLPLAQKRLQGLTEQTLASTERHVASAVARLDQSRLGSTDGPLVQQELRWVAELLQLACQVGIARIRSKGAAVGDLPESTRAVLRRQLQPVLERHGALWLARNRVGGMVDSLRNLQRLERDLTGGGGGA